MSNERPTGQDHEDRISTELTQTEQRSLIFHLLYVLYAFDYDTTLEAVTDGFKKGFGIEIPSDSYVFISTQAVAAQRSDLDQALVPLLENWRFDRLGVATTLILRLAVWELQQAKTDPAVIINEAVELAKCFAEKDAFKFVNGVLDEYAKRSNES